MPIPLYCIFDLTLSWTFTQQVRKPDGSLSECQHCFPVYGGGLEVKGVEGILQVRLCVLCPSAVPCSDAMPGACVYW